MFRKVCVVLVLVCPLATIARVALSAECRVERSGCKRVPLANGAPGETVLVCEHVKVVCE